MKILHELSWLWETLGIALVAAAVCMACAALIGKAAKKKLDKKVLAVIGAAAFVGAILAVILIARTPMPLWIGLRCDRQITECRSSPLKGKEPKQDPRHDHAGNWGDHELPDLQGVFQEKGKLAAYPGDMILDNRYLYDILTEGKYPERIPLDKLLTGAK